MTDYVDVPPAIVEALAPICLGLPETRQEPSWAGVRWKIRQGTFAHVVCVDRPIGPVTVLEFRAPPEDLDDLVASGFPFQKAEWGDDIIWMVISEASDWDEIQELLTESYCLMAPKKLVALVDRPEPGNR